MNENISIIINTITISLYWTVLCSFSKMNSMTTSSLVCPGAPKKAPRQYIRHVECPGAPKRPSRQSTRSEVVCPNAPKKLRVARVCNFEEFMPSRLTFEDPCPGAPVKKLTVNIYEPSPCVVRRLFPE